MTVSLLDDGRGAARIATALYLHDETPERVPAEADAAIQQAFLDATLRLPMRAAGLEASPPLRRRLPSLPHRPCPAHGSIRRGATVR